MIYPKINMKYISEVKILTPTAEYTNLKKLHSQALDLRRYLVSKVTKTLH